MSKGRRNALGTEALDAETIAHLGDAVAGGYIDPAVAARLRGRIMASLRDPITEVVRAADGEWLTPIKGVSIKILHTDRAQGMQTSLWRLAPGARIPPHPHSRDEECLVLEGAVVHDDVSYGQGDYLFARAGVRHTDFVAPAGALLMIRSELLPNPLLMWIAAHLPG